MVRRPVNRSAIDHDSRLQLFRRNFEKMEVETYIDVRIPSRDHLCPTHRRPSFLGGLARTHLLLHAQQARLTASLYDVLPRVRARSRSCRRDRRDQSPSRAVTLIAIRGLDWAGPSKGRVRMSAAMIYMMHSGRIANLENMRGRTENLGRASLPCKIWIVSFPFATSLHVRPRLSRRVSSIPG